MPARPTARDFITFQPNADRWWAVAGVVLWIGVFLGVAAYSYSSVHKAEATGDSIKHTVSTVYWTAAKQWWGQQDMYGSKEPTQEGRHGFLYFPQAAVLFSPLAYLPVLGAEVLWRLLNLSMAAWALWRMCKVFGDRPRLWFGLGSLIAMPAVSLSAQNGQCNLILMALAVHATVDMIQRRWCPATILLCLGLALKPHMLVYILLLLVLQPPMRWRLPIGIVATAAIGLMNPDWRYVWQEHSSFIEKMHVASKPPPGTEQDLVSLVWCLGFTLPDQVWTMIRLGGAGAISLVALLATRRFDRSTALLFVLTLFTQYIMLFNPRTEGPTHAMMAVSLAIFTMQELTLRRSPRRWLLLAGAILLGLGHSVIHGNRWLQTTIELGLLAYLSWQVLSNRPAFQLAARDPHPGIAAKPRPVELGS